MAGEKIEGEFTIPSSTSVSASNSGGGATTVTVTAGASFLGDLITDFQTQLNNTRAPSSGSWTVSESNGRVSIACTGTASVPSFSLDWTSTALRDTLGFTKNINYPTTADLLEAALGYGDFTNGAGYLCNESSGDLSPVFGSGTLADASSPTYSNLGPRGGDDKAVGFDSASDGFNGGNIHSPGSNDLAFVWVGNFTGTPSNFTAVFSKGDGSTGWIVFYNAGTLVFSGPVNSVSVAAPSGWHVGAVIIDQGTGKIRVGHCSLISGTVTVSSEGTAEASYASSASLILGGGGTWLASAATPFSLAAFFITTGSGVATGLSANLSTALSNFAATFGTWTGSVQASGVWYSGCPIAADSDPKQAPTGDDGSWSISPTGRAYRLMSTEYFRHRNVRFSHVSKDRVWANDATVIGADWETFYLETQNGHHSWFEKGARVKVYWDNAGTLTELGNGDVEAWRMPQCTKLDDLRLPVNGWTGLVEINLGDLYTDQ